MKEDQERTPLRTILQNFLNHIESLEIQRAEDSYEKEFQELKFFSEILKSSKQYSCSEGEKEVNRKKNRYKDILPFDNSRVILSEYAGVPGSDYINANYIKGASGSPAYIACQGPLPHTVNDFWRMVVECEVQVIVMACNEEEAGKHKCENYWVEREGEEKQFGMVAIRLVKASTVCPDFLVRTMRLKYTTSQSPHISEERTVCQFHYSAWPDHGVPPLVRPLLDMVRLVRDTQASETLPVLVHCSAGCGRTGTICAIDYVWGLLRAGKLSKDFSLYKLVQDMRKQRIAMVQTKEQYVLVHQAVRELFREQLRMIDSHPYENIDANGMPLVKEDQEPTYASPTISVPTENSNEEKQDGKEKEFDVKIPPLPQKKRLHVASSKQEKEVENLTEKQRSIFQQATASHKPRIAKLKALFERSPVMRESRSSQIKQRNSSLVSRSHSLGAMHIKAVSQEEQLAIAEGNSVHPVLSHAAAATTVHAPQICAIQTSALTVRPSLPVKRSKSLKVLGSNQRCKLSLATTINSITPTSTSDESSDSRAASSTPVENISLPREESAGATNVKPFIPPKKYTSKSREVSVKDSESVSVKSSKKKVELFKSQKSLDWMNYESSHMVPKRRRSLESVNFENAAISDESSHESHNFISPLRKSEFLDDEARRIFQDCKDYLVSGEKHSVPQDRVTQPGVTADILTLEAQRKVNAIIAGLGVRERRNSFRQAVGTGQEGEAKSGRKFKDYEAIWPCGNAVTVPTNAASIQIKESHPSASYVNILMDSSSNATGPALQSKGKTSTWFPKTDERKLVPATSISTKNSVSQMSSLEQAAAVSSNVRIGKLGIHPKQLTRSKPVTPERRLAHSSQTGSEQASQVLSASAVNPPNLMQSPSRSETIAQTPKSSLLWLRKTKSSAGSGTVDLRNYPKQESGFYNVIEHEFGSPWVEKTPIQSKVQAKEMPYKCNGPVACHRKAPVPNHEHVPNSRVGATTQVQYKPSLPPGSASTATTTSSHVTAQMKKPSSSQEISYGLVAGVQLRRGSRDDLALCPSPTCGNATGPHAPSRVRRHASVVLLRRSLAETGGKMNSSLPHSTLAIWNSPTSGSGDRDKSTVHISQDSNSCDTDAASNGNWLQAPGVDVDTVAASISPQQGDQSTSHLSRAFESFHIRKSPHHKSNSMSNIQSTLSNGFTSHQLSQPTGMGKKQHYF